MSQLRKASQSSRCLAAEEGGLGAPAGVGRKKAAWWGLGGGPGSNQAREARLVTQAICRWGQVRPRIAP